MIGLGGNASEKILKFVKTEMPYELTRSCNGFKACKVVQINIAQCIQQVSISCLELDRDTFTFLDSDT